MKNSLKGKFAVIRSILPTLWFNFHYLPFRQAVKLPVLLYKPHLYCCDGTIRFEDGVPIHTGMVRLGFLTETVYPNSGILWDNRGGEVVFRGPCIIGGNSNIKVGTYGKLHIGSGLLCTTSLKLVCYDSVVLGDMLRIGWEVTIMDTDFHRVKTPEGKFLGSAVAPIEVGHNAWLCTQSLIMKGTFIPPYCIVSARSLVKKRYDVPEYSLLAGSPAMLKKTGLWRDAGDPRTDDMYAVD